MSVAWAQKCRTASACILCMPYVGTGHKVAFIFGVKLKLLELGCCWAEQRLALL